jgi:hypothetical protein
MFKKTLFAVLLPLIAANGLTASGSPLDRFSFDYAVQGDARAKPLQVFDDGQKTYLQYRSTDDIPAFISAQGGQLLMPRQEGPYTVINGTPKDFIAQLGNLRARITHSSAMSNAPQYLNRGKTTSVPTERILLASLSPTPGAFGHVQNPVVRNDWTDNSYASPARGDQVSWAAADIENSKVFMFERGSAKMEKESAGRLKQIAASVVGSSRVVISSADDTHPGDAGGSERARVIRNQLVAAGVSPSVISVRVGFLFDEQLQRSGKKLFNPTTVTWTEHAAAPRPAARSATKGDESASIVEALRTGRLSPSQAIEQLQRINRNQQVATTAPVTPAQSGWTVRKADQNIEHMLIRWANDSGWKVIWKGAPAVEITADAERPLTHPDFLQAADYVVTQAKFAGYRIKATAYNNQVLVITGE